MPLSSKSLAGPGYVILNGLRGMNIISLLAVITACTVALVKIKTNNQFFFFEAVTHVVTTLAGFFLIVSELTLFRTYFARHWPVLSPSHSFVALGVAMEILGCNILGNLNKPQMRKKELGLAFWRIIIGAGVLVIIVGVFNIVASFVFRDRGLGVTARQIRAKGAVALDEGRTQQRSYTFSEGSTRSASFSSPTDKKPTTFTPRIKTPDTSTRSPIKFPKFGRPTLPSYHTSPYPRPASSNYSEREGPGRIMEISGPIGINPQFAHLVKPNNAYHPSQHAGA